MPIKISKVAKDLNIALPTVIDFLQSKGINVDMNPNTRIDDNAYNMLVAQYGNDKVPAKSTERQGKTTTPSSAEKPAKQAAESQTASETHGPRVIGHINLDRHGNPIAPEKPKAAAPEPKPQLKPEPKPEPKPQPKKKVKRESENMI